MRACVHSTARIPLPDECCRAIPIVRMMSSHRSPVQLLTVSFGCVRDLLYWRGWEFVRITVVPESLFRIGERLPTLVRI